eukprot:6179451-Pleurochrysis_carterae.AAC.1
MAYAGTHFDCRPRAILRGAVYRARRSHRAPTQKRACTMPAQREYTSAAEESREKWWMKIGMMRKSRWMSRGWERVALPFMPLTVRLAVHAPPRRRSAAASARDRPRARRQHRRRSRARASRAPPPAAASAATSAAASAATCAAASAVLRRQALPACPPVVLLLADWPRRRPPVCAPVGVVVATRDARHEGGVINVVSDGGRRLVAVALVEVGLVVSLVGEGPPPLCRLRRLPTTRSAVAAARAQKGARGACRALRRCRCGGHVAGWIRKGVRIQGRSERDRRRPQWRFRGCYLQALKRKLSAGRVCLSATNSRLREKARNSRTSIRACGFGQRAERLSLKEFSRTD